ncbi:hypothetical protein DL96DRAFT_1702763 [Flagelloscypha sp. PMI_526]|nr:hypothetical protein DL96DRAFT_1702763 [Flagelloscypha sp. PMI_526]
MSSGYQRIPGAWPEPLDSRSVIYQSEPRHLQQVVEFHRKLLPRSSSSRSLASGSVSAAAKVRDEVEITPPSVSRPDSRDEIEVPRAAHGMALQPIISHPAAVKSKLPELQLVSRTLNSQLSSRISSHSLSSTVPSIPSPIAFASPSRSLSKSPRPILCNRSISDYVSDSTAQDSSFENSFQSSHRLLAHRRSRTSTPPKIRFQDHPAKVYTPIRDPLRISLGTFLLLLLVLLEPPTFSCLSTTTNSPVEGEESWSLPDKLITPSFEKLLINEPPPDASDLLLNPPCRFMICAAFIATKRILAMSGHPLLQTWTHQAVQYAEAVMDSSVWQPREGPD